MDIEARGNSDDRRRSGLTPLLWATEFSTPRAVTTLLDAGADPLTDSVKYNAVNYAVLRNKPDTLRALLDWDSDLAQSPDRLGSNALNTAMFTGDEEIVDILIGAGTDLNARETVAQSTPLFVASGTQKVDLCLRLVRAGADASIRDIHGKTFLPGLYSALDKSRTGEFLRKRDKLEKELRDRGFPVETGR